MAAKNARRRVGARLALSLCCSFACAGKADNFVSLFTGEALVSLDCCVLEYAWATWLICYASGFHIFRQGHGRDIEWRCRWQR